ncbi:hypothetical protein MSG28_011046 [Choristoneura fumiferana]|uniref:Uncharacterized protein n=1 Tax=Choristoneura fumiferana TaxID=7141 RepID=A0ACC0KRC8_CHOFU|nr:hypothetical protein MSG28_011046 [Choristoneura fumiferana]
MARAQEEATESATLCAHYCECLPTTHTGTCSFTIMTTKLTRVGVELEACQRASDDLCVDLHPPDLVPFQPPKRSRDEWPSAC